MGKGPTDGEEDFRLLVLIGGAIQPRLHIMHFVENLVADFLELRPSLLGIRIPYTLTSITLERVQAESQVQTQLLGSHDLRKGRSDAALKCFCNCAHNPFKFAISNR